MLVAEAGVASARGPWYDQRTISGIILSVCKLGRFVSDNWPMWTQLLALLVAVEAVVLGYFGWLLLRKTPVEPPPTPITQPEQLPAPPERVPLFVRQLDHDADMAALTRRLVDLEAATDQRHQAITGLIGNLQQQLKRGERGEKNAVLAEALSAAVSERSAPAPQQAVPNGLPVVRIRRT